MKKGFLNEKDHKSNYNEIHRLFVYKNGFLIRKIDVGNSISGTVMAYSHGNGGYTSTPVNGKLYKTHRLIWLYHNGYMPEGQIDHIDRNKSNNKIENLREVSQRCNNINSKISKKNTSGVTGVTWHKSKKIWQSQITIRRKSYHLGSFCEFDEAVAYRLAAEQCLEWGLCNKNTPAYRHTQAWRGWNRV